ncbi:MurR/RpiR family transcriptional regulator [Halocynthiibacter sp.]|uniref:MurR/RpiR family transcriptional regulator n=1 Tax=Halocynthiibacter sp. TaxID=1979210 RepID=UPI003C4B66A9
MDPTVKIKMISKLKADFEGFSPRLRVVAKYIVDNPGDFGLDPIRETARKAGVSTYTLVRMAQHLGFEGFEDLRAPFRTALVSGSELADNMEWLEAVAEHPETGQTQVEATLNSLAITQRSLHQLAPEKLQRVVDLMFNARNVYLTGVRASYGLAYYFHYVGRMALPSLQLIPRHMNSSIDELNYANEEDILIVITVTPYSKETIHACQFAKSRGIKLIMISDSEVIASELNPEEVLVVSTITTHFFACYSGAMAVIENILALLVKRGGKEAEKRIESYEDLRSDVDAYWTKQKKH